VKLEKIRIQTLKQVQLESGIATENAKIRQAAAPPRSVPGHLFTENPWGAKARRLVQATEKLDSSRWEMILDSALHYVDGIDLGLEDEEEISDTLDENDYAMVDLN
jgi:hypothetical protein